MPTHSAGFAAVRTSGQTRTTPAKRGPYDPVVVQTPSLVVLLGLPLWVGPPLLLIIGVTRLRLTRIAFGAVLAGALTFLYVVAFQLLQGQGLPTWIEGLVLWGPTTLAVCGAAFVTDRWLSRRRGSDTDLAFGENGSRLMVRRTVAPLAAAFVGWSVFCGGCLFGPAAELFDLRVSSPPPALVLPLPDDLTLVSADRDCGSEQCSDTFLIGSPDQASLQELTRRIWAHLAGSKGWRRLRDNAGCQRLGWFARKDFCLFVSVERTAPVVVLKVHATGAAQPA